MLGGECCRVYIQSLYPESIYISSDKIVVRVTSEVLYLIIAGWSGTRGSELLSNYQ